MGDYCLPEEPRKHGPALISQRRKMLILLLSYFTHSLENTTESKHLKAFTESQTEAERLCVIFHQTPLFQNSTNEPPSTLAAN